MIDKIRKLINTKEKKRLLENFISLSILQGANYILPLITLPYLVRVLGPEKFGLIAFARAFVQYFNILTDYGFNLSATREISINRENPEKISEIFNAVMLIKIIFLLISLCIITLIVFSFEKFRNDWTIYYLSFGIVIGQVLFPVWFFQGMEKMKYITFLDILARVIFTTLVFVVVKHQQDYAFVPLLNALGYIIAGILSLGLILKDFQLKPIIPSIKEIKYQLKEGWYIFISTVAISLYTISNTFILGIFTNNEIVGYYSAAEKLIKAIQGLFRPIFQATYPYISKLIKDSPQNGILFLRKLFLASGYLSFFISIIIFIFADPIVKVVLGTKYIKSIIILKILSFLPFIIVLSNILGIQTMLNFNFKRAFATILLIASFINIILAILLVPHLKAIGISIAVVISEIFVTTSMFIYLHRKGIRILEGKIV